jgi:hypothetical protein
MRSLLFGDYDKPRNGLCLGTIFSMSRGQTTRCDRHGGDADRLLGWANPDREAAKRFSRLPKCAYRGSSSNRPCQISKGFGPSAATVGGVNREKISCGYEEWDLVHNILFRCSIRSIARMAFSIYA